MMHRALFFTLCYSAFVVTAVSFLSNNVYFVRSNATRKEIPQNNAILSWNHGNGAIAPASGRFRFLHNFNMRRGNSGSGRSRKQKGSNKLKIAGIEVTVTNILIAVNMAVFLAIKKYPRLSNKFMKYDRAISNGQGYRLLTSVFLHKALYHVGANSYSLYQIGPLADKIFGSSRYLCTYIFSGVFANVLTFVFKSSPASLGASGCTFGIIGAFATHFYRNKAILGKAQSDSALSNIKRTVLINLMYGFSMPNVDNGAHIGGFVAGALFAYLFGPRYSVITKSFGRTALVDRPLVPYTKYWKMINPSVALTSSSSRSPGSSGQGEGYTEEINFSDDAYSLDDDFSSDSTGMRGGQGQGQGGGTRFL